VTIDASANREAAPRSIWLTYAGSRYTVLFYALLFMLVAMPVVNFFGLPSWTMKGVVAVCLVLAVLPNATKRHQAIFVGTILLLILARFLSERDDVPIDFGPILALYALTGLLTAAATFRFVVRSAVVDHETVYAALSTYLLAGLFFGVLYSAIENIRPGSFTGPDEFTEASAIYYSFVTLATLGYGDFLPRTEFARGIATFEVIGGQLYLAVMVARLIGAFGTTKS
jgi:Ion channel